jgi:hypothetical protein
VTLAVKASRFRTRRRLQAEFFRLTLKLQPDFKAGTTLRIQAKSPFLLHWTNDDCSTRSDAPSKTTAVGIDYADIVVPNSTISMQFTFFWRMKIAGKPRTTTFKSGQLLRCGAESRCE